MSRNILDIEFVRKQFPVFQNPKTANFAFFENAGGTYVPKHVIEKLNDFMITKKVQPYGDFGPSIEAGNEMDNSLEKIAELLNISKNEFIIGPSTDGDEVNLEDEWPEINWDQIGSTFTFDNTNCRIGVSFPSVTTLMNMDGGQDGVFQQNLPLGEECNFILMAPLNDEGDVFAYAIKNTTIGTESEISITSDEILIGDKFDLIFAVNNL